MAQISGARCPVSPPSMCPHFCFVFRKVSDFRMPGLVKNHLYAKPSLLCSLLTSNVLTKVALLCQQAPSLQHPKTQYCRGDVRINFGVLDFWNLGCFEFWAFGFSLKSRNPNTQNWFWQSWIFGFCRKMLSVAACVLPLGCWGFA